MDQAAKDALFDNATFYDCNDDTEHLSYESVEEAIVDYVESHIAGCNTAEERLAEIRDMGDITVYAWTRDGLEPRFCERAAERAFEMFEETYADEYANVDNGPAFGGIADPKVIPLAKSMIEMAFKMLCNATDVWRCTRIASREFTTEQVIAIVTDSHPELFEWGTL